MFISILLSNIIYQLIVLRIYYRKYELKVGKKKFTGISIVMIFSTAILQSLNISQLNFIVTIILDFLIFQYCFDIKVFENFGLILRVVLLNTIFELITIPLCTGFFGENYLMNPFYRFLGSAFSSMLLLECGNFFINSHFFYKDIPFLYRLAFLCLPMTTILLILNVDDYIRTFSFEKTMANIILVGLLISNIVSISLVYYYFEFRIRESEYLSRKREFENSKVVDEIIEMKMVNQDRMIHDFKKHMRFIYSSLNEKDTQSNKMLCEYLQSLNNELKKEDWGVLCKNKVINIILNSKTSYLKDYGINVKVQGNDISSEIVSLFDQEVIFSNIIDNAIESCVRSKDIEKNIVLKIILKNNQLIIKMVNTCTECKFVNGNLFTVKGKNHGLGMKNVKSIISKYNGNIKYKYDEENHLFSTVILICF